MPRDIYMPPANLHEAEQRLAIAREQFLTALAIGHMEGSIRALWKKLEPHIAGPDKSRAFGIVSVALAHAWKKGYEAQPEPLCRPNGQGTYPNPSYTSSACAPGEPTPSTTADTKKASSRHTGQR